MRTLHADLTSAQQGNTRTPYWGATSFGDDIRYLQAAIECYRGYGTVIIDNSDGAYDSSHPEKGDAVVLNPGYVTVSGNKYSTWPTFYVRTVEHFGKPGASYVYLTLMTNFEKLAEAKEYRNAAPFYEGYIYNEPAVITAGNGMTYKEIIEDLCTDVGVTLAAYTQGVGSYTSEDSIIDTKMPYMFIIPKDESRLDSILRLLRKTGCELILQGSNVCLIYPQAGDSSTYTYSDGAHWFTEAGEAESMPSPNKAFVLSYTIKLPYDNISGGSFSVGQTLTNTTTGAEAYIISVESTYLLLVDIDTENSWNDNDGLSSGGVTALVNGALSFEESTGEYPVADPDPLWGQLEEVYEDKQWTDAECASLAEAIVKRAERQALQGEVVGPINVGQEIWDVITVVNPYTGLTHSGGRVGRIEMRYGPGIFDMTLGMGGYQKSSSSITIAAPAGSGAVGGGDGSIIFVGGEGTGIGGGTGISGGQIQVTDFYNRVPVPAPDPVKTLTAPEIPTVNIMVKDSNLYAIGLTPSMKGYTPNIQFYAKDNDEIYWDAGTISMGDGVVLSTDARAVGSAYTLTDDVHYVYFVEGNSTLQVTANSWVPNGPGRGLVATAWKTSDTDQKAAIQVVGSSKPIFNEDNLSPASISATHIQAGAIDLASEIVVGDLDDIDDGTSYKRVLATEISSGYIKLTDSTVFTGTSTLANNLTGTINTHAATLIEPGKIQIWGSTNLGDWRHASDYTKIDGGNLQTGSVLTSALEVVPTDNLALNGDWEASVDGTDLKAWTAQYTSDAFIVTTAGYTHGGKALRMRGRSAAWSVYQDDYWYAAYNDVIHYAFYARAASGDSFTYQVYIYQYNSGGSYLGAVGTGWLSPSTSTMEQVTGFLTLDQSTCAKCKIRITINSSASSSEDLYIDDLEFYKTSRATFYGTVGAQRVVITGVGIEGYNSGGTRKFFVDATTGLMTCSDAEISGTITCGSGSAWTGNSIGTSYTDAKCTDPNADQTSANTANNTSYVGTVPASTVQGWRYSTTTYINGGNIYTGTVTANQIAALTITGDKIAATTITGAKIAASTITADKLSVSTLSAITANIGTITSGTIGGTTINCTDGQLNFYNGATLTGYVKTNISGSVLGISSLNSCDMYVMSAADLEVSGTTYLRLYSGGDTDIDGDNVDINATSGNVTLDPSNDVVLDVGSTNHVRPYYDDYGYLGGNSNWRWKQINAFDIVDHSPTFPIIEGGYLNAISNIQVNPNPHPVNKRRNKVVPTSLPDFCRGDGDRPGEKSEGTSLGNFTALAIGGIMELIEKVEELQQRIAVMEGA